MALPSNPGLKLPPETLSLILTFTGDPAIFPVCRDWNNLKPEVSQQILNIYLESLPSLSGPVPKYPKISAFLHRLADKLDPAQKIRALYQYVTLHTRESLKELSLAPSSLNETLKALEENPHLIRFFGCLKENASGYLLRGQWPDLRDQTEIEQAKIIRIWMDTHQDVLRRDIHVLTLGERGLTALPSEIRYLESVTHLVLSRNQLTELPPEIENLSRLTHLDASYNQLRRIPPQIRQFQNLIDLTLSYNQLTEIPNEILALFRTEGEVESTILDLSHNQIARLPNNMHTELRVNVLCLQGNQLSNETLALFENNERFETVWLREDPH